MSAPEEIHHLDTEKADITVADPFEELPDDLFSVLTERQAEVMVMKLGLGDRAPMSQVQIASELGISTSTVSVRASLARRNLGQAIKNVTRESLGHTSLEYIPSPPHPWQKIVDELLIHEIELLDLMVRNFSNLQIGEELGIGGTVQAKKLKTEVAEKFGIDTQGLLQIAPEILRLAGER